MNSTTSTSSKQLHSIHSTPPSNYLLYPRLFMTITCHNFIRFCQLKFGKQYESYLIASTDHDRSTIIANNPPADTSVTVTNSAWFNMEDSPRDRLAVACQIIRRIQRYEQQMANQPSPPDEQDSDKRKRPTSSASSSSGRRDKPPNFRPES